MAVARPIPGFLQVPLDGIEPADDVAPDRARTREAALTRGASLRLTRPVRVVEGGEGATDTALVVWRHWLAGWGIDADPAPMLADLRNRLGDPARRFHHLDRVGRELESLEHWRAEAEDPVTIGVAIWFKDAVLDPRRVDNEARSASLARSMLGALGVDADRLRRLQALIVSTRPGAAVTTVDARVLADIERAFLADPRAEVDAQEAALREESAHMADFIYWRRRADAIRAMLTKPRIYRTASAHEALEAAARDNLARRLEVLRSR